MKLHMPQRSKRPRRRIAPAWQFEFEWEVATEGHVWVGAGERAPTFRFWALPESSIYGPTLVAKAGSVTTYKPLRVHPGLFRVLSEVPAQPEAIAAFANRYGLLAGAPPSARDDGRKGDKVSPPPSETLNSLRGWTAQIGKLRTLVQLWDVSTKRPWSAKDYGKFLTANHEVRSASPSPGNRDVWAARLPRVDPTKLAKLTPRRAHELLAELVNDALRETGGFELSLLLPPHPAKAVPLLTVAPRSLAAAVWLQFAGAIAENKDIVRCGLKDCAELVWFERSTSAVGSRADSKWCSRACRNRGNYLERTRSKGRE